jgi:hypothetical protein
MSQTIPNQVIVQEQRIDVNVDDEAQNLIMLTTLSSQFVLTNRFTFTQAQAASTWTINHTLGGKPSVTIVDSANTVVYGEVQYVSNSQVVVVFSAPFSGFAFLT